MVIVLVDCMGGGSTSAIGSAVVEGARRRSMVSNGDAR